MQINRSYAVAATLMGLTVGLHVFGGGPEIHDPIRASAMPDVVRAVGSVLWHAVTWILILMAVALAWISYRQNSALFVMVIAIQAGFAALFLFYGWTLLGTVWEMGQWTIFSVIPAVMLLGHWQERRSV
ncbi:hypothetical protein FEE96_14705 [Parasedimentitalea maritima]|uniref:DUF423 domain-containing protein n=1 Tax=Parasedimentitalea maritima TaxID=2578117 RepID=A0ABY2UTH1_9RHOB|nr:hypothetical protein [Zongyanglinia marina]TLP61490.1 hypothetical protein FEE96_14705 [Zongyanglinia marina]